MTRYLIIGTGAAGVSAAETIREIDPAGQITLVGEEPDGYYSRPGLAYFLTGELPETQLQPMTREDFGRRRFRIIQSQAVGISAEGHMVQMANGEALAYDRLLLAVGAEARKTRIPGHDLPGVVQLDSFSDARGIIKRTKKARSAVVIGGGITALEIVEGLCAQGVETHYFLRGDRYWSNVLDEIESKIVEHRLEEEGIHIHYHTEAEEIYGKPAGLFKRGHKIVAGVRTNHGTNLPCQIVAIAIGIAPRLALAQKAGLKVDRGVIVNEFMNTSEPDIFAAGDIAQVFDPATGRYVLDSLWPLARKQGQAAGANMAGHKVPYLRQTPLNVTRLAGLTTTIIGTVGVGRGEDQDTVGIVRGDSETWREIPDALISQQGFDVNRIRLMVGETTILGAIVIGDQTLSRPIHKLVENQVDISPIRPQLQAGVNIGDVLAKFWGEVKKEIEFL